MVVNHGTCAEADLVSEHPQPPAEVDVLVKSEEVIVEAADGVVNGAIHDHRAAAREQQTSRCTRIFWGTNRCPISVLVTHAVEGEPSTSEIDALSVPALDT